MVIGVGGHGGERPDHFLRRLAGRNVLQLEPSCTSVEFDRGLDGILVKKLSARTSLTLGGGMDLKCHSTLSMISVSLLAVTAAVTFLLLFPVVIASAQSALAVSAADSVPNSAPSWLHSLQLAPFPFGFSPLPSLLIQSSETQPAFSSHLCAVYVNVSGGSLGCVAVATFWKSRVGLGPGIFIYTSSLRGLFSLSASFPLNGQRLVPVVSYAFVPSPPPSSPGTSPSTSLNRLYHPPFNPLPRVHFNQPDSLLSSAPGSK